MNVNCGGANTKMNFKTKWTYESPGMTFHILPVGGDTAQSK